MRLSISSAANCRTFAKAVQRLRPRLAALQTAFELQPMLCPIQEALLLGITDGLPAGTLEVIPNQDGFFQVLSGMGAWPHGPSHDDALLRAILDALGQAVLACPFVPADKEAFGQLVAKIEFTP